MRRTGLALLALLSATSSQGQTTGVWLRFEDAVFNLSGYKDTKGTVRIPAIFLQAQADSFYHIMAVAERSDPSAVQYYLLKNGRKVAQDSVFRLRLYVRLREDRPG